MLSTARKQTPNSTKPFCKRNPSKKGESQHQNQLISTFELLTSFTFHCWIYICMTWYVRVAKKPRVPFTAPLRPCWIRPISAPFQELDRRFKGKGLMASAVSLHPGPALHQKGSRWWFQIFFIFTPTWGRFPFWPIFFKWVETTN